MPVSKTETLVPFETNSNYVRQVNIVNLKERVLNSHTRNLLLVPILAIGLVFPFFNSSTFSLDKVSSTYLTLFYLIIGLGSLFLILLFAVICFSYTTVQINKPHKLILVSNNFLKLWRKSYSFDSNSSIELVLRELTRRRVGLLFSSTISERHHRIYLVTNNGEKHILFDDISEDQASHAKKLAATLQANLNP